jgi:CubicO group peptidase (beta-lactamase class C family)
MHSMPRILRIAAPIIALVLSSACAANRAPAGTAAGVEARIRRVENGLLTYHVVRGETPALTIHERLREYRVPGVSVAVINNGRIEWARGWGEAEAGSGIPVDTATLFQAASISKPVAAVAALRLVEAGQLALDEDVNARLRSWQVPASPHTATEKVTLRRLLSHSAGTTVHGFPGYAAGATVPSAVQVLNGEAPANSRPVRVDTVPGSLWRYSGGGITIAQLMMTDVTGRPFAELMREYVLEPAGMRHSTYAQPLPAERAGQAATAHRGDGTPLPGKHHTYPEQAAAGLWTTPSDLARLAIEVQRAYNGQSGRIFTPETARLMLTTQSGSYGLGFAVNGEGDSLRFEHGGSNQGFRAFFMATAQTGKGVIVMTNGENGAELGMEVLRAVAREYGLPGHAARERDALRLDAAALAAYAGSYASVPEGSDPPTPVQIQLEGDVLSITVARVGWNRRPLRASAPDTFFFLQNAGEIVFTRDASGAVVGATLTRQGQRIPLVRR